MTAADECVAFADATIEELCKILGQTYHELVRARAELEQERKGSFEWWLRYCESEQFAARILAAGHAECERLRDELARANTVLHQVIGLGEALYHMPIDDAPSTLTTLQAIQRQLCLVALTATRERERKPLALTRAEAAE